jgi:hypothetical protein
LPESVYTEPAVLFIESDNSILNGSESGTCLIPEGLIQLELVEHVEHVEPVENMSEPE